MEVTPAYIVFGAKGPLGVATWTVNVSSEGVWEEGATEATGSEVAGI